MDRVEVAAFGHTPKQALRLGLSGGDAWTALVDGRPEAMFGVVVHSALSGECTPWMLGTDEIYRHGRELVRHGPDWVERLFDSMPRAANIVSAGNTRAIRLLNRWGFVVEQAEILVGGVAFRSFWKERD
jgi:hypothetical protein